MEYRDYYATLGVPRTASAAEIKKSFRKLARQHHPDVNKGDPAGERRFKEVNEAYAVLGDAEKRKAYDALGADWEAYQKAGAGGSADPFAGFRGAGAGAPGGIRFEYHGNAEDLSGFSDFFRTYFGGGAQRSSQSSRAGGATQRSRGRTRTGSLEDLFAELDVEAAEDNVPTRGGRPEGKRARSSRSGADAEALVTLEEVAAGTTRQVQIDDRRLQVTIPAGVADGQRIRLTGTGAGGGDVHFRIKVAPHPIFVRNGADLQRELPLTLAEALLGAEVPVETLTGRVLLRIPPETQNGRNLRLAGQGLPRFKGEGRGDLYVRARVVLPSGLDDRARELAGEFLDLVKQPNPRSGGGR
jgi:DnaJ-class molecular chaperone